MTEHPNLLPLNEFPKKHEGFTAPGLRWLYWRSRSVTRTVQGGNGRREVKELPANGFKTAFRRIGRRIFIDEDEFFACIDRQNERLTDAK